MNCFVCIYSTKKNTWSNVHEKTNIAMSKFSIYTNYKFIWFLPLFEAHLLIIMPTNFFCPLSFFSSPFIILKAQDSVGVYCCCGFGFDQTININNSCSIDKYFKLVTGTILQHIFIYIVYSLTQCRSEK